MMRYEEFIEKIKNEVEKKLDIGCHLKILRMRKNNGIMLDGLSLVESRKGVVEELIPVVYLNAYYVQMEGGMTLDEVVEDILESLKTVSSEDILWEENLNCYEHIQDKIVFRIINAELNKELLKNTPHIKFLDLAIVFYLYLYGTKGGQLTAMIHDNHINAWNCSVEDLWKAARVNTPKILPVKTEHMESVMKEIIEENLGEDFDQEEVAALLGADEKNGLEILTNQNEVYGAGCMLYENVLRNYANFVNSDLVILPSSVHEVLLFPDDGDVEYDDWRCMVTYINAEEVLPEEVLSNEVYRYIKETDQIVLAPESEAGQHSSL